MLIDRAIEKTENSKGFEKLHDYLKVSQVFVIGNVADYYFQENPQDVWLFENDFPNVAPSFENMWFEYNFPRTINKEGKIIPFNNNLGLSTQGFLLVSHQVPSDIEYYEDGVRVKWVSTVYPGFHLKNGELACPKIYFSYFVGENGEAIYWQKKVFMWSVPEYLKDDQNIRDFSVEGFKPCWLALSFLHCKNVEMQKVNINEKLQLARLRRGRNPLVSYHLLHIHPMTRIIDETAITNKTNKKMALHICRGHFKDYSKGDGLFGKFKGLYWWDSFIRGSKESGLVLKDYKISPMEL